MNAPIPPNVADSIKDDLRRNGLPHIVARRYGVSYREILSIKTEMNTTARREAIRVLTEDDDIPEHLRKYMLQVRIVGSPWEMDADLIRARAEYDAGLIELAIGRVRKASGRDLEVLYRFERKKRDMGLDGKGRFPYFAHSYEG